MLLTMPAVPEHPRCECADGACESRLNMTWAEYEVIRSDFDRAHYFLVIPEHLDNHDTVLRRCEGYVVVKDVESCPTTI